MKVFIIIEDGKDIGFGHLTRCIDLYQAIEENGESIKLLKIAVYHSGFERVT